MAPTATNTINTIRPVTTTIMHPIMHPNQTSPTQAAAVNATTAPIISEQVRSEPSSVEAAQREMEQLLSEYESIETQLGSGNKTDASGARLSGQEYLTWRYRAITAHRFKKARYQFLKNWLKQRRQQSTLKQANSAAELLTRVVDGLVEPLLTDDDSLTPAERILVKEALAWRRKFDAL